MNRLTLIIAVTFMALSISAQRRISPVTPDMPVTAKEKTDSLDRSRIVEMTDANGNTILVDTVSGKEVVDSAALKPFTKMIYPLFHSVTAGVNIWDGAMRAIGQHYGIGSVWAWLSLHNRYMPYVEVGLGKADDHPDDTNFRFRSPLAPFFKIGINYNFLYNSTPDYQIYAGLHYGFTPFKFSVEDITVSDDYWGETSTFTIPSQNVTAGWIEFVVGIKVKIVKNISMGWCVGYHSIIHSASTPYGNPLIIPGFGKRSNTIMANVSIIYTLPLNKAVTPVVNTSE